MLEKGWPARGATGGPHPSRMQTSVSQHAWKVCPGMVQQQSIARIDLALAHAQLGDPDDAIALGHQALDSARVVDSVLGRADDLTRFLARRYPRQAAVEGLRERLTTAKETRPALPASPTGA